jgi:hypothetical protein
MSTYSDASTRPTYFKLPVQTRSPRKSPLAPKNLAKVVLLSIEAGVTLSLVIQSLSH